MLTLRLTRRRLAGCALVALAGGAWWLVADRPSRLTSANFDRVFCGQNAHYEQGVYQNSTGWTVEQVSAVLGPPFNSSKVQEFSPGIFYQAYWWDAFGAEARLTFRNGRSVSKYWYPLDLSASQKVQRVWYWLFVRKTIPVNG
jgi:hypothetical protein